MGRSSTTTASHDLVLIHLSGGNDYLNTVIPYADPMYYSHRPTLGLGIDGQLPPLSVPGLPDLPERPAVLPLDDRVGLHGALGAFKELFDQGRLAVLMGIGYPDRDRSHFRSLDIWHTAAPESVSSDGWLGRTATRLDPQHDNPLLLVNVGRSLPLAMAYPGVLAASLDSVAGYNIFPADLQDEDEHARLAGMARGLYERPEIADPWRAVQLVGQSALRGIDDLSVVPHRYRDVVAYPRHNPIADRLKVIAQIKSAGVGGRIFHTSHDGYDTHDNQLVTQHRLFAQLAAAVTAFLQDLEEQDPTDETVVLVFSEFGRRIAENRGGTDHGGAGIGFLIGNQVRGGLYGDYPKLERTAQLDGDLRPALDFREVYTAILEQFLHVESRDVLDRPMHTIQLHRSAA